MRYLKYPVRQINNLIPYPTEVFSNFSWFDMTEQLKECLIVHAASICTIKEKVNGLETDITFWIAKPTDWI